MGFKQLRNKVQGSRLNAQSTRHKVQGSRHKIQVSRFKVQDTRFKVQGLIKDTREGVSLVPCFLCLISFMVILLFFFLLFYNVRYSVPVF
jgi:hypothetical protein